MTVAAEVLGTDTFDADTFYNKITAVRVAEGNKLVLQKSCPENAVKLRERYKDKIDGNHILTEDLLFTSPSTAAAFVGGSSLNGNELWKTDAGVTLKHLDRTSD